MVVSRAVFAACMGCSALVGSGNVLKNGINSSMSQLQFHSSTIATTVGVTGALVMCCLLELLGVGRTVETPAWGKVLRDVRPWMLLGGVLGAASVGLQTFLIDPIGAVLLHVVQLSTELVVAIIVDSFGCLALPKRTVTPLRVIGVATSIIGACSTVNDFEQHSVTAARAESVGPKAAGIVLFVYLALAVLIGCVRPVQTVVNGGMRRALHSPIRAATVSIMVSLMALGTISAAQLATSPQLRKVFSGAVSAQSKLLWWHALSGPMSTYSVVAPVVFAPVVSLSGFSGASMTGQLATSLLADHFGVFGMHVVPLTLQRAGGVFVVLCGAFIVRWADANSASKAATAAPVAAAPRSAAVVASESEKRSLMDSNSSEMDEE
jgi:transporter family-2 protein